MKTSRLVVLATALLALPSVASADDGGITLQFGAGIEGGGFLQDRAPPYTPGILQVTLDATLGIPVSEPFEILVGGFANLGIVYSIWSNDEDEAAPGLLGAGAGGALNLGGWRMSALAGVVASRLYSSHAGMVTPPVGPGLWLELGHTWWPSEDFGIGVALRGTLASIAPEGTRYTLGNVGAGYYLAFR